MSNSLTAEVQALLKAEPSKLIITIGNSLRSDDGLGPYIASKCQKLKPGLMLLDAGDKPENILDKAVELKPKSVVIIDAADFGGTPGEARIIPQEAIPDTTLSTHTFPLRVTASLIAEDTGAAVYFLGVQPQSVEFEEGLSPAVKATAEAIVQCLASLP